MCKDFSCSLQVRYAPAVLLLTSHTARRMITAGVNGATLVICAVSSEQLEEMLADIEETSPPTYETRGSAPVGGSASASPESSLGSSLARVWTVPTLPNFVRHPKAARKSLRRLSMAVGADRCEIQSPHQRPEGGMARARPSMDAGTLDRPK